MKQSWLSITLSQLCGFIPYKHRIVQCIYGLLLNSASIKWMKRFLVIFAITNAFFSIGQMDSITTNSIQFCQDVFKDTPVDSSYSNFYIKDQDTLYFNNFQCVMLHQLTTPGTTLWKTKTGFAQGKLEYHIVSNSGSTIKKGTYSNGYFINGTHTEYYPNGKIRSTGKYSNGLRVGIWHYYKETGDLDFDCVFVDGVCSEF